jgi:hypothetical protein
MKSIYHQTARKGKEAAARELNPDAPRAVVQSRQAVKFALDRTTLVGVIVCRRRIKTDSSVLFEFCGERFAGSNLFAIQPPCRAER